MKLIIEKLRLIVMVFFCLGIEIYLLGGLIIIVFGLFKFEDIRVCFLFLFNLVIWIIVCLEFV